MIHKPYQIYLHLHNYNHHHSDCFPNHQHQEFVLLPVAKRFDTNHHSYHKPNIHLVHNKIQEIHKM